MHCDEDRFRHLQYPHGLRAEKCTINMRLTQMRLMQMRLTQMQKSKPHRSWHAPPARKSQPGKTTFHGERNIYGKHSKHSKHLKHSNAKNTQKLKTPKREKCLGFARSQIERAMNCEFVPFHSGERRLTNQSSPSIAATASRGSTPPQITCIRPGR